MATSLPVAKAPEASPTATYWRPPALLRDPVLSDGVSAEMAIVQTQVLAWPMVGTPQLPLPAKAQFDVSTAGYNTITVSADVNATGQAERNLAILYTLDDTQATPVWSVATITSAGSAATLETNSTSPNTITGNYLELSGAGSGWNNLITASVPASANSDPNFAVEIVNASTGADDVNTSGNPLNNSSGNWRYDNVIVSGTAVPEPASASLLGLAGLGLLHRRRAKANSR